MRAWELHEQGWKQKDIAAALGVTEGAVSQWLNKANEQGAEALQHQPAPGATPKLTKEQRAQLPALLSQGAEAFGYHPPDTHSEVQKALPNSPKLDTVAVSHSKIAHPVSTGIQAR